jgi:hypothetical protein
MELPPMLRHALLRVAVALVIVTPATAGAPEASRLSRAAANPQGQAACGLPPSRKVDEYGAVAPGDERARLERFASALDKEPEDTAGFIVAYAGRGARAGEAIRRADRAKAYLVEKQVLYNPRINTLDCGYRERPAFELWITAAGAAPPLCSPTVTRGEARILNRAGRHTLSRRAVMKARLRRR